MNWITNSVLPKIKAWVGDSDVPDHLWIKCPACDQMLFHTDYRHHIIAAQPVAIMPACPRTAL